MLFESTGYRARARAATVLVILVIILASSVSVSAWGPKTREYFCRRSVERVWSFEEMLECIPYGEYETLVAERIRTLYPSDELKRDYTSCPVTRGDDWMWVCGNSSQNPTGYLAEVWFNKSRDSHALCERIVNYCIAADFYVNQFHPLHHTNHVIPRYYKEFNEVVDERVKSLDENWTHSQLILFEHYEQLTGLSRKARYQQKMTVRYADVTKAFDGLIEKGLLLKAYEFPETTTTTIPRKPTITLEQLPPSSAETTPPIILKPRRMVKSEALWSLAVLTVFFGFLLYAVYRGSGRKQIKVEEVKTGLWRIPGITHSMVEKLVSAGITTIPNLMRAQPRRVAKKTGLILGDVKAIKKAQRDAFCDYFLLDCPLTVSDLTPAQKQSVTEHKKKIKQMMKAYRHKSKLSKRQLSDLDEIMRPLSGEEALQVQKIIDGKVKLSEDQPYRILVTSAEIDVGKIRVK